MVKYTKIMMIYKLYQREQVCHNMNVDSLVINKIWAVYCQQLHCENDNIKVEILMKMWTPKAWINHELYNVYHYSIISQLK